MKKLLFAVCAIAFCTQVTADNTMMQECEAQAVNKSGKPLVGRHHDNFMLRCMSMKQQPEIYADCEKKAVSKDGKPIYGAAKNAAIDKCLKLSQQM